jgi:hypothetical protein
MPLHVFKMLGLFIIVISDLELERSLVFPSIAGGLGPELNF